MINLARLKERVEKATEGPWKTRLALNYCPKEVIEAGYCKHDKFVDENMSTGEKKYSCAGSENYNWQKVIGPEAWTSEPNYTQHNIDRDYFGAEDANFIAHARTDIPKLIEAIEILSAACEEMKNRSPYKCNMCDGGERYQETAEEALELAAKKLESVG